jgi:hypothetical protein
MIIMTIHLQEIAGRIAGRVECNGVGSKREADEANKVFDILEKALEADAVARKSEFNALAITGPEHGKAVGHV